MAKKPPQRLVDVPDMKGWPMPKVAAWINENMPGLQAEACPWTSSTDRQLGRLRSPGKGRKGYRLTINRLRDGGRGSILVERLHRHTSSETYRESNDVARWLRRYQTGEE